MESWDWEIGERRIADVGKPRELAVSADGEHVAAATRTEDSATVQVDGTPWEGEFEKAWHLRFLPTGQVLALVMSDDEWTVAIDGASWSQTFDFAWNPRWSTDGSVIAVQVKDGMDYTLATSGETWEQKFPSMREYALSPDGQTLIAAVQVEALREGDTEKFSQGVWAAAVNDKVLPGRFLNVWGPAAAAGGATAAQIRTGLQEFGLLHGGTPWPQRYAMIWEPVFSPTGSVLVPVKLPGGWSLARDQEVAWDGRFDQLVRLQPSPDGSRVAAVVATEFGKWTVAVDGQPWPSTWNEAVLDPVFSPDGSRVAAAVRQDGAWTIAVDGQPWSQTFEAVWDPVFSPGGDRVAARVRQNGSQALVIDDRRPTRVHGRLWDPVFSPDGSRVLIRALHDGACLRSVAAIEDVCGEAS
jgi:hypothetical protein